MQRILKDFLPHLVAIVLFTIISLAYFSPVMQGKKIFQSDIVQYNGMAKQQNDYRKSTGEETYWTNSAFGGMPTYQLGAKYPHNYIKQLDLSLRFLPRPADYLFLYLISIYIFFLVMKVDYRLAIFGSLAFGFSTYLIIILGVGHNAKAHAIAYMPLVLSGIMLTFRRKYLAGFLLTTVAMGLELVANHFQMTYYLLLLVVCIGVAYLVDAVKKKQLVHYFKSVGLMAIGVLIAVGLNATNILATKEYADTSTRGKSELTINPDGTEKIGGDGLSYEYITEYSYGIKESLNLFIPRLMGGGSSEPLPNDGATVDALLKLGASPQEVGEILGQLPVYWGDQPIVAAPAYVGAITIFLALLGLFLVKGRVRWWITAAFLLSLFLSWGDNFKPLTEFFINVVPLYDKFRAVSSIQVIIELVLPVLAVLGLHQFFNDFLKEEERRKSLLYATAIASGVTLLLIVAKSALFDFASPYDQAIREQLGNSVVDAIREDRTSLFRLDALRTLVLVMLSAAVLWFSLKGKLKTNLTLILLAVLLCFDLIGVNRRYVNEDDFVPARIMDQPFQQNLADQQILEDDGYFRVYDITTNPFGSGRASYFHNALGGYHAAKPGRIQDLDDFYLAEGGIGILNMMNVRYIIASGNNGTAIAQRNPYANGNAWFVENVLIAEDANQEILLLDSLDTKRTAVIHREFKDKLPTAEIKRDSLSEIDLISYKPEELVYESSSKTPQLALFSENYYPNGWNAYINDQPAEYIRANYAIRAMVVPAGNHQITFRFEPKVIQQGSRISLFSSLLVLLIVLGGLFFLWKSKQTKSSE